MALTAATDKDPWCAAPDSLWRNNNLDPHRFGVREALCQREAREQKVAEAIEAGRIYGMRTQKIQQIRQQKLEAVLQRVTLVSPPL